MLHSTLYITINSDMFINYCSYLLWDNWNRMEEQITFRNIMEVLDFVDKIRYPASFT